VKDRQGGLSAPEGGDVEYNEVEAYATAAAVPGVSHVCGGGTPCQDAAGAWRDERTVILALSDGHGDKKYTRSEVGAAMAVDVAIDCMRDAIAGWRQDAGHFSASRRDQVLEERAGRHIPARIISEWYRRVRLHDRMVRAIGNEEPAVEEDEMGWTPVVTSYGATLLVVAIFDGLALALQLGDGEIVWADAEERGHRVFEPAEKKFGSNATESLATAGKAVWGMQVVCRELPDLRFVLLCSDGVADPYIPENARARAENREEELHAHWGSKFLRMLNAEGEGSALDRWHKWASTLPRRLTSIGQTSGDDVSAAVAWFPEGPWRRSGHTAKAKSNGRTTGGGAGGTAAVPRRAWIW